jgi:hypothetical protein
MLLCGALKWGERHNPQIIQNSWKVSKILLADLGADFAMDDEHEKSRMKQQMHRQVSFPF